MQERHLCFSSGPIVVQKGIPVKWTIKVVSDLSTVSDKDIQDVANGDPSGGASIPTDEITIGKIEGGMKYISIDVNDDGFSPAVIVLQKGIETK